MTTKCFFHPEKIAVATCSRCFRPICLEDKRLYNRSRYIKNPVDPPASYEYCPMCYASQKETDFRGSIFGIVVYSSVIIIVGILFLFLAMSRSSSFPILGNSIVLILVLLLLLVLGGVFYYSTQGNKEIDEAYRLKNTITNEKTDKNTKSSLVNSMKPLFQKQKAISRITCFNCGIMISSNDIFCPNCGDDTKDELESLQKSQ